MKGFNNYFLQLFILFQSIQLITTIYITKFQYYTSEQSGRSFEKRPAVTNTVNLPQAINAAETSTKKKVTGSKRKVKILFWDRTNGQKRKPGPKSGSEPSFFLAIFHQWSLTSRRSLSRSITITMKIKNLLSSFLILRAGKENGTFIVAFYCLRFCECVNKNVHRSFSMLIWLFEYFVCDLKGFLCLR